MKVNMVIKQTLQNVCLTEATVIRIMKCIQNAFPATGTLVTLQTAFVNCSSTHITKIVDGMAVIVKVRLFVSILSKTSTIYTIYKSNLK